MPEARAVAPDAIAFPAADDRAHRAVTVHTRSGVHGGYLELVYAVLPVVARRQLEELMSTSTDGRLSEPAQYFVGKGEARGRAASVLGVLEARGIEVPQDVRGRVLECQDLELLDTWMRRAVTARTVDDLDG